MAILRKSWRRVESVIAWVIAVAVVGVLILATIYLAQQAGIV